MKETLNTFLLTVILIFVVALTAQSFVDLQARIQLNNANRYCAQLNAQGIIIDREPYCLRVYAGSTFLDSVEEIEKELKGEE